MAEFFRKMSGICGSSGDLGMKFHVRTKEGIFTLFLYVDCRQGKTSIGRMLQRPSVDYFLSFFVGASKVSHRTQHALHQDYHIMKKKQFSLFSSVCLVLCLTWKQHPVVLPCWTHQLLIDNAI